MLFRVLLPLLSAGVLMAQPAPDRAATARKALDALLGARYSELTPMFTPEAQKAFPETALAKLGAEIKSWGAVQNVGEASSRPAGPNTVVTIPVSFASNNVNFLFGINSSGQVSGMFYNQGQVNWLPPAYARPDAFRERQVTIGEDEWKLPGTLTVPAGSGPFPAVVLVHGAGPNDRDETVGANKMFKDLAVGLASQGVVVLRYEKRTRQYARKLAGAAMTVADETVDDAARAAALLRTQPEVDPKRVFVLGHGLGGYVAPRIAAEDGKLAGIAVLAGYARPIEDVVLEESIAAAAPAPRLEAIKAGVARVKALEDSDADAPPVLGLPAMYWLDLKGYDPAGEARKLPLRVLVLQGERDFQASMKDYAIWKAALGTSKTAVLKSYPALNHLFIAGEGKSTEAEYRKPGHVAPEVVEEIAKFVKG
jgi:hypothetical protein